MADFFTPSSTRTMTEQNQKTKDRLMFVTAHLVVPNTFHLQSRACVQKKKKKKTCALASRAKLRREACNAADAARVGLENPYIYI